MINNLTSAALVGMTTGRMLGSRPSNLTSDNIAAYNDYVSRWNKADLLAIENFDSELEYSSRIKSLLKRQTKQRLDKDPMP